jgi:hypothetical protein
MDNNMTIFTAYPKYKDGLPMLVADDDFIEHLHEQGYSTIDIKELYMEWDDWAAENVL